MTILGYARVSTDGQDLAGQRRRLVEAGAIRVFEDTINGRRFERPGLAALLDYARPGDTIAVVRLDRLGRSTREVLELVEDFRPRGLALRSLEDAIDTGTPAGVFQMTVFAAVAQLERDMIASRTRDGLAAARARGTHIGRPARDPAKVEAALRLVDSGLSAAASAKAVGLGRTTVYEALDERQRAQDAVQAATVAAAAPKPSKPCARRPV